MKDTMKGKERVTYENREEVKIVNLTSHVIRLFPLMAAGRVLRGGGGRFFDAVTGEEIPYVAFDPEPGGLAVQVVTAAYRVERWVHDAHRGILVPVAEAKFRLHPPAWEGDMRMWDGVWFIVPTAVITYASARWGDDHPFVAPLGGSFAVRDEQRNVIGTVALVRTVELGD
ncbi:MAG: hypothetical protein RML46_11235, partial [Anaerolineae bacterium]|nr:hypothetical protein [Anaerolineae bacterium]